MSSVRRLLAPPPAALVALLAAPTEPSDADGVDDRVRDVLARRLAIRPDTSTLRVDAFMVERGITRFAEPFRWTVRGARRTLGTAALRHLDEGRVANPLRGATEAVAAVCDRAQRGLARRGALGTWLAAQPRSVRCACAVEAATWATGLVQLVDLDVHHDVLAVGIPDAWVELPFARTTLHGRVDATPRAGGGGLLRVRDGVPGPRAVDGLVVDGVIATLGAHAGPDPARPGRVLGVWPDAGACLVVELDAVAIRDGLRSIVRAVPTTTDATAPVPAHRLAA